MFSQKYPLTIMRRVVTAFVIFASTLYAAPDSPVAELSASVVLSKTTFAPHDTVTAVLHVSIPDEYHLFGNPIGEGIGKPVTISIGNVKGIRWLSVTKTAPKKMTPETGGWVWAYEKNADFFCTGVITDSSVSLLNASITIQGLICSRSCIPICKVVPFVITVSPQSTEKTFASHPELRKAFAHSEQMVFDVGALTSAQTSTKSYGLTFAPDAAIGTGAVTNWEYEPHERTITMNFILALLFGFLAGIILNVMPCVLPVLGIKVLSLVNHGHAPRREILRRSSAFAAGILSVFILLASLASFAHLSWGQQFQSPVFLMILISLAVVFALGMFDVYIVSLPGNIGGIDTKKHQGLLGDFLRGILATLLATPCSGPFLGATLAWTLTQSTAVIFAVFISIGCGMAFPYMLFASNKTLLKLIPKPGKWMVDFKYFMGFMLLFAAVYLMFGLPKDMVVAAVCFCVVVAFGVMLFSRFAPHGSSAKRHAIVATLSFVIIAAGCFASFDLLYVNSEKRAHQENSGITWVDFSPESLKAAHANGRHVIVDFTANWCMNCQYNLATALASDDVARLVDKKNILAMKADLTEANPAAESLMHQLGSRSVPFFAVFPGDAPYSPVIMRDILSKGEVVSVLRSLADK